MEGNEKKLTSDSPNGENADTTQEIQGSLERMEGNEDKPTSDSTNGEGVDMGKNKVSLEQQILHLETENRKIQFEFNMQRAKLKDLFLQKETEFSKCLAERNCLQRELDELKSQQLVADLKSENEIQFKEMKAQEEISSLQQLVQDTIEESTICKAELEQLKVEMERLRLENADLRSEVQQHQETTSLTPQVLSQVKRKIVRKLGGDFSNSMQQESFDDTTRPRPSSADTQYAHEDAEVLRPIVEQLQEEMKALKEKLREADIKLQAKQEINCSNAQFSHDQSVLNKSTSMELASICSNCQLLEQKLNEQIQEAKVKYEAMEKSLAESSDELQKEAALRKDLEDQWQEKREAHKTEVQLLREQVKTNEQQLLELQQKFLETKDEIVRQLQRVSDERERVNKHLETLQADNDFLSGRYLATAEEIESQYINLPNTVNELHELILQQQNELIQARVSSQFEKRKCETSLDEIQILRDQLEHCNNERRQLKKKMQTDTKSLQDRLTEHLLTVQNYETTKAALERKEAELNRQISELRVEIIELQESNEKLNKINTDQKAKIKNLQDDLATSEHVQKDFVKLSQTLQMSLEELRHADTEVRWQDDDDVDHCPSCNIYFTVTVRKIHCRHCGHIYCEKCLTKSVPSGPRKRNARVCDICHTLLQPHTAPYFSHETTTATASSKPN